MMTLEELERRAYISGNVELAAAYGAAIDVESEQVEKLEHEVRELKRECDSLESELEDVLKGNDRLESELGR